MERVSSVTYKVRLIGFLLHLCFLFLGMVAADLGTDIIGLSTAEILNLRGFNATDHYYTTTSGYILHIVSVNNPKIPPEKRGRYDPLFFIHGFLTSSTVYVVNSQGAAPRDLSDYNAANMTPEQLEELVAGDPSFNNLPMAALNFGYECWLIDLRGTKLSLGQTDPTRQPFDPLEKVPFPDFNRLINPGLRLLNGIRKGPLQELGLTGGSSPPLFGAIDILTNSQVYYNDTDPLYNPRYWNYSIDEQCSEDIPEVIDWILEETGKERLSIVGYSLGGALTLGTLTDYPAFADKVSRIVLWAPAADLAGTTQASALVRIAEPLKPVLINVYVGPLPPAPLGGFLKQGAALICANPITSYLCQSLYGLFFGGTKGQDIIEPGEATFIFDFVSSHETVSLLESASTGTMHHFDWHNPIKNLRAYGQISAPIYDFSKIRCRSMTIFSGNADALVTPTGINSTISRLSVPVKAIYINDQHDPGVLFAHGSYIIHKNVAKLAILPSLRALQSSGQCT